MPTSHYNQINEIVELIYFLKPKKILDIGIGYGKYGFLSREYLEIWGEIENYNKNEVIINGLEAYKDYLTEIHQKIYDNIFIGNALDVLPEIKEKYDLILLIDVIEHFEYNDGIKILKECFRISNNVIVSTPKDIYIQEDVFNNPFEVHKFQWEKKHFKKLNKCLFVKNTQSIICCMGNNLEPLQGNLNRRKRTDLIFKLKMPLKRFLKKVNLLEPLKKLKTFIF